MAKPIDDNPLDQELDYLRSAIASHHSPSHVESALMLAFAKISMRSNLSSPIKSFGKHLRDSVSQWLAPGIGLAASISMAAWMVLMPAHRDAPNTAGAVVADAPFFALQSLEQIASEPAPTLVETQVPRMWLASYGMPINPETAAETIRAQVLVSATGMPLALRFSD